MATISQTQTTNTPGSVSLLSAYLKNKESSKKSEKVPPQKDSGKIEYNLI